MPCLRTLSLLALLAAPVFAASSPDGGTPAPAPTSGPATTATPKGEGVKKAKPAKPAPTAPEAPKPPEK